MDGALTAVGHRLVVSGGFNNDDDAYELDSVEIYQPGTGWRVADWRLSHPDIMHCMLGVNETHVMIITGETGEVEAMEVEIVNVDTGARVSIKPPPGTVDSSERKCVRHQEDIFVSENLSYSPNFKIYKYSLASGEWDTDLPELERPVIGVQGLAMVNGALTVFDWQEGVFVLRDRQWHTVPHQRQNPLNRGTVVVVP